MLASSQMNASPMPLRQRQEELDRCNREQAEIKAMGDNHPAWLTTLAFHDWEMEKSFLVGRSRSHGSPYSTEANS